MLAATDDGYQEIDEFDYLMIDNGVDATTCSMEFKEKGPEGGARWIRQKARPPLETARQPSRLGRRDDPLPLMAPVARLAFGGLSEPM